MPNATDGESLTKYRLEKIYCIVGLISSEFIPRQIPALTATIEAKTMAKTPARFKKVRSLTRNLLKMKNNREYYVKFEAPIFTGEKLEKATIQTPARLAHVINLETGEQCQIIVNTVLEKELTRHFPGDAYVGKCFALESAVAEGKQYKTFNITEIEENEIGDGGEGGGEGDTEQTGSTDDSGAQADSADDDSAQAGESASVARGRRR